MRRYLSAWWHFWVSCESSGTCSVNTNVDDELLNHVVAGGAERGRPDRVQLVSQFARTRKFTGSIQVTRKRRNSRAGRQKQELEQNPDEGIHIGEKHQHLNAGQ